MNRIIIVGNGFDLAHNLKTSYRDFINWYWEQKVSQMETTYSNHLKDVLCSVITPRNKSMDNLAALYDGYFCRMSPKQVIEYIFNKNNGFTIEKSDFFKNITLAIETKGWVDIENEYYQMLLNVGDASYYKNPNVLNNELEFIKDKLVTYLSTIQENEINTQIVKNDIRNMMFSPIDENDITVEDKNALMRYKILDNDYKDRLYNAASQYFHNIDPEKEKNLHKILETHNYSEINQIFLPFNILVLNFNYTSTADLYLPQTDIFSVNHIHGMLEAPDSIIFGYGDELDENYKKMVNKNDNAYLKDIKSIKYLESNNYRKLLQFIESETYQIFIMGHSCGNSDRTLLNTLFEHKNCVSIKPYYFQDKVNNTDNYTDIVQNISRNFTDMKLMRSRVVNKKFCMPFSIIED